ncbi:hypothetical protein [Plebeiibacterium sediminum]|uniref:Uncharacterized protein n=1 Tax=Plebeiibacterium sediminum TaxID=2992112 RepID=A0AAE3SHP2_9BACT|nr:hypothetical protein [Plebeiobacterium sediminum]MCW3789750.1 hypothetical protein [Plebeiobacterium sediminum]
MAKEVQHIEIEIDKLTNSIENAISGDRFETEILEVSQEELRPIKRGNGWQFDWKYEFEQTDRKVFKLTIIGNPKIIQGLVSISDYGDHMYMHLIESAPFNKGKNKLYVGVPGNLVAYLCKTSWDKGYEGISAFMSKTRLIEHYEKMLGAVHVGGHKMIIFPEAAVKLIKKYFKV